ncbi:hypothetical protein TELCIR_01425 [Teladorsagia circumcincta]|uniref:Uncharacterized protein n=1 Tax=Teladorsagia circumcincta TaxID=45464 RepID=A0A2G9V1X7_TELCI|nr:hypothetical protein TELCIR_01425 [Teladorsagia circumcincta]
MRQDSLTTTMLTQTLRIGGRSRLEEALDAVGMSSVKLLQPADMDNVIEMLDKLVAPDSLVNDLLVTVARVAAERFPDEPHILRRVLSNVFILRFVNPLLISYMSGNLMNQQLAKGVQAAANVAAAASPRLEDVTVGSQCLRALFERLRAAAATAGETEKVVILTSCLDSEENWSTHPGAPPKIGIGRSKNHHNPHEPLHGNITLFKRLPVVGTRLAVSEAEIEKIVLKRSKAVDK